MGFCVRLRSLHLLSSEPQLGPAISVHASDADQAEVILIRWGPDGLGKLGGKPSLFPKPVSPLFSSSLLLLGPRWAVPIKAGSSTRCEPGSRN